MALRSAIFRFSLLFVPLPGTGNCTGQLDPVCGCNGKSYVNAGCAAADGTRVAHTGQCP